MLATTIVLMSPLIWPPDPDASLEIKNGQLVGETIGYVWQTDADTGTIHVTSSLVGLRRTAVTVTAGTKITVGDKYGAFADLVRNVHVRVLYESHDHVRLASSIEVFGQGAVASAVTKNAPPRVEHTAAVGYWVEVGVFADPDTADGLVARLLEQNLAVSIEPATSRDGRHRVLRRAGRSVRRRGQRYRGPAESARDRLPGAHRRRAAPRPGVGIRLVRRRGV